MSPSHGTTAWRTVSSIREVPGTLWDDTVARGHPFKTRAFLSCLEDAFPRRRYHYVILSQGSDIVGLALVMEERFDLTLLMPAVVARFAARVRQRFPGFLTLRLAMVGTFETSQRHWWFDPHHLSEDAFAEVLLSACRQLCPRAGLLLVRDFTQGDAEDARLEARFRVRGFAPVRNLPLAVVDLGGRDITQHLQRLRSKPRASVRRQLEIMRQAGLKLERVRDFRPLIPECYPLYLQVHERATEFKRAPIPQSFFELVAERLPESSLLTLRTPEGQLIGFILGGTSRHLHNPCLLGMDYAWSRKLPVYYPLVWSEIAHAAEHGCEQVDLGLTNYFMKQTMGATLEGLSMAARVRWRWLRPLLHPLLPALVGEAQPRHRNTFLGSHSGHTGKRSPAFPASGTRGRDSRL